VDSEGTYRSDPASRQRRNAGRRAESVFEHCDVLTNKRKEGICQKRERGEGRFSIRGGGMMEVEWDKGIPQSCLVEVRKRRVFCSTGATGGEYSVGGLGLALEGNTSRRADGCAANSIYSTSPMHG